MYTLLTLYFGEPEVLLTTYSSKIGSLLYFEVFFQRMPETTQRNALNHKVDALK